MESNTINDRITENNFRSIDWNSMLLLLLLTVPAGVMAIVLHLWPDVEWIAEIPYTAIGILGAFAAMLLSVFIIARYRQRPGIIYVSAGLMAMAIINGIQSVLSPESSEFVWLHTMAGIFGSAFFSLYICTMFSRLSGRLVIPTASKDKQVLIITALTAGASAITIIMLPNVFPEMMRDGEFTWFAWLGNIIPVVLFLFSGVSLFINYRKTGSGELFLFTGIVIFLFQASEVFYMASLWGVIWWLWMMLRFVVYIGVLSYVLIGYIQTSNSLTREIVEREYVEKALRKAEENWRNSFNSLEEVMMIVAKDFTIENINDNGMTLLGKDKEDIIGKKCYQVMPCHEKQDDICPLNKTFRTSRIEHAEWFDEEKTRHIAVTCSPIISEDKRIDKCVFLMKDITDRVESEAKEKLLQQELNLTSRLASIGEVAAGITHEINNPLTSVMAFAQMLSQKNLNEDTREAVEVITESSERIANIVDKLLAFARRHKKEKEYIDINTIINSVIGMRSYEMRNNNIELKADLSPDVPYTMANVGELQQVFLNIVINAEQAITLSDKKKGKILIETGITDKDIRIIISDDGPGIAKENIDKLFDPFFTTKDENGGTGLGLSISYGIIKEHGGRISARSIQGEGAVFVIDLPIVAEIEKTDIIKEEIDEPVKAARSNILVVDDEANICAALDKLLSREGHNVETIRVAEKALNKLRKTRYDLILLDIKMPGIDGIEFYHRLKDIEPSMQEKVICITGDIISPRNKEFLDETGINCITKPFGIDELIWLVNKVIGGELTDAKVTYSYS